MTETALTVLVIAGLSLVPLLLVVLSSYAKIAIVLTILRNAIGAPGVPPNIVITGLAVLLTGFVLAPVAGAVASEARPHLAPVLSAPVEPAPAESVAAVVGAVQSGAEPIRNFLQARARPADRQLFAELAVSLRGSGTPADADALTVLAPAFATSELRAAFIIGIAVLLPFLVIDLMVANVLAALGLPGLPVATVAVPLKLTLFVTIEGWQLLTRGLIAGYL